MQQQFANVQRQTQQTYEELVHLLKESNQNYVQIIDGYKENLNQLQQAHQQQIQDLNTFNHQLKLDMKTMETQHNDLFLAQQEEYKKQIAILDQEMERLRGESQQLKQTNSTLQVSLDLLNKEKDANTHTQKLQNEKLANLKHRLEMLNQESTAPDWLHRFEKLIKYHEYSDQEALLEFMMAMRGDVNRWWMTLSNEQQASYTSVKEAFKSFFFGSEEDEMATAIKILNTIKQGSEPMTAFGPRLLSLMTTVTKTNFQLQLNYFKKTVRADLVNPVMSMKPSSIQEAIRYAASMKRNDKQQLITIAKPPQLDNPWPPTSENDSTVEPMDLSNAQ
ncbi:hypothetical protein BD560DRAFT_444065 [Blakeslea trispora]|nr:hypothetical protein BD560DRAFT_444057 [Blakeslea trispora]KAI8382942.1 hypothetical protein BD560DRAFT_444065 [Blakeslea trispora]